MLRTYDLNSGSEGKESDSRQPRKHWARGAMFDLKCISYHCLNLAFCCIIAEDWLLRFLHFYCLLLTVGWHFVAPSSRDLPYVTAQITFSVNPKTVVASTASRLFRDEAREPQPLDKHKSEVHTRVAVLLTLQAREEFLLLTSLFFFHLVREVSQQTAMQANVCWPSKKETMSE